MKKSILLIFSFLIINILSAQIGINTTNPLAMFHMDGDGLNSTTPTATEQLNDVVITKDGNLGIGIINPLNKLSINSTSANTGLHLPNGASAGNVLVSDALGNSTWQSSAIQFQTMIQGGTWRAEPSTNTPLATSHPNMVFTKITTLTSVVIDKVKATFGTNYGWNNTTQEYIVPTNGIYRIGFAVYFMSIPANALAKTNYRAYLAKNGSLLLTPGIISVTDAGNHVASYVMGLVSLNRDDKIDLRLFSESGYLEYWSGDGHTFLLIESL